LDLQPLFSMKLFGSFEVRLGGSNLSGLHARDADRLLAFLTLRPGQTLPGASVASVLWPETGSLDSLRQSVTHLRQVLQADSSRLQTPRGSVLLDLHGADVDLIHFDEAVRCDDTVAQEKAVALYRGSLLNAWEDRHPEDRVWVGREREKRKELFRDALRAVARAYMVRSDYELATKYLQQYVNAYPAEEWAWSDWMKALVERGERAAAKNLYTKCGEVFQQRFQLPHPPEMTRIYELIRVTASPKPAVAPLDHAPA